MLEVEQFFTILWAATKGLSEKQLWWIDHVPYVCMTLFSKVVMNAPKGDKQLRHEWITGIGKKIFFLWDAKWFWCSIVIYMHICGWPFPTWQHVGKFEMKVAGEQNILWEVALLVFILSLQSGWQCDRDMTPVNSSNGILKIREKFQIVFDLGWNKVTWRLNIHAIVWCTWEDMKHLLKIPKTLIS